MRIGITGHRGLPDATARRVRAEIAAMVRSFPADDLVGVSCISDGPDSWFAEEILASGGRLEVVVPAAEYRNGLPDEHHAEYDRLVRKAAEVHETGLTQSNSESHQAGSEIMVGLVDQMLAVWDGQVARGYGGTADVVAYAERTGVPVRIIWPEGASRD